ncbi:MAG: phospho-N-acetylmuramoyl-pentapeptide-transferase, partial [Bdellovibrionales bacterium]|nr:phospho-N-acetylmuramoyl-pentapeptide-transferase [Bdellovibrionales bacterium]
MIYKLLVRFAEDFTLFNVFRYITFRSVASFLTSFLVVWLVGKPFIARIQRMQFGQQVRDDGPQTHKKKQGTPTLGGILILLGVLSSAIFWADLANPFVIGTLIITLTFGAIGFVDDYLKISKKNTKGLSGKIRLVVEFTIVGVVLGALVHSGHFTTELSVPFFKEIRPDLGWFYILFAAFVTVGCANAVNLTDGLDGLATVPVVIASFAMGVFAYVHGHSEIARYLQLHAVQGVGELTPLAGAMIGAGLGFLWYNSYPAQIFMGDVGSLSLGGFIGSL